MANKDLTEIIVLIDESGSMGTIRNDTIGGFNGFLNEQRKLVDGKANFTVVFFSYGVKTYANGVDVNELKPLDDFSYRPSGGTALLDAIGDTIRTIEDRYTDEEDEAKIPSKVIFAIITDGEENSSIRFVKSDINKMIKHQTKRHGWEFAFLGANLDAVKEAESIGIRSKSSFNFAADSRGINDSYAVLNSATSSFRSSGQATYGIAGTSLEDLNQNPAGSTNASDNKMNPSNM